MGFFDVITTVDEVVSKQSRDETLSSGVKRWGALLLLYGIITGITAQFFGSTSSSLFGLPPLLVNIIGVPLVGLLFALIGNALMWIAFKLVGGKGSFGQQFGVSSLVLWPLAVIGVLLAIVLGIIAMAVPLLGLILVLAILYPLLAFFLIYIAYFTTIYLKEVHELSSFRVFLGLGIYAFFIIVLLVILILILGLAILSALGLGAGSIGNLLLPAA